MDFMITNKVKQLALIFSLMGLVGVVFGFGCSEGFSVKKSEDSASNLGGDRQGDGTGAQVPPEGVLKIRSAGVPILSQNYASLVSGLQILTPSVASRDEFTRQLTNLSDSGQPQSVGSSLAVAFLTLGAQVCLDRVTLEINQNAAQKVFFNSINLAAAPANNVSDQSLGDSINRIARSVWQRNETAAERAALILAVNDSMALDAGNNANETQEAALFLCTAMVASSSGLQM